MPPLRRHLALVVLGFLGACDMFGGSSDQGNAVAGGSSDQGNAVQVRVLDRFGIPVVGARVDALPSGWMWTVRPGAGDSDLRTDSTGHVLLRLDSGAYSIVGQDTILRSRVELDVSSATTATTLWLRAPSNVVGILATGGVDTLFVPGTRCFGLVGADRRFRIDSLPQGANVLSTRDGRRILLDSSSSGFERVYRDPLRFGGTVGIRPDSLVSKYVSVLVKPLVLDAVRPTASLESWRPDTVYASGDTIWINASVRVCDALPREGLSAWSYAESLYVYKRGCPDPAAVREPVTYRFFLAPRTGIWYVTTLQPIGYTWEMP